MFLVLALAVCYSLLPSLIWARAPDSRKAPDSPGARDLSCTFDVRVPASTPSGDGIFMIGNHQKLGAWKGAGVRLAKIGSGTFRFQGAFPPGTNLEFKFTRGDFSRVEKNATGGEIPNRVFPVTGTKPLEANFEVTAWADQGGGPATPSITGKYQLLPSFPSKFLPGKHNIWVLLPPSYETASATAPTTPGRRRYPVLYMHDGNNLFDPGTSFGGVDWGIDETVDFLVRTHQMEEIIVVGIGNNPDRNDEYTPFPDPKHGGGKGELYGRFIVEELKPAIDKRFSTRPEPAFTAIGGSSLGGLISLYIGLRYPQVFSGIIAISPSFWWADGAIISWACSQKVDLAQIRNLRLWTDIGLLEGDEALSTCRKFDREFRRAFPLMKFNVYREFPNAAHNEAAWRARVAQPILHLFGKILFNSQNLYK